jgi:hypothetical protein
MTGLAWKSIAMWASIRISRDRGVSKAAIHSSDGKCDERPWTNVRFDRVARVQNCEGPRLDGHGPSTGGHFLHRTGDTHNRTGTRNSKHQTNRPLCGGAGGLSAWPAPNSNTRYAGRWNIRCPAYKTLYAGRDGHQLGANVQFRGNLMNHAAQTIRQASTYFERDVPILPGCFGMD